jgi:acyl carrier protein phosphodiesterase
MNYLAHLYLADGSPHSLLGNLLGDFVKGNDLLLYPDGVQRGIRLHRRVDSFTDRHPVVQRSLTRISHRWGWFAGIIIDVYYDHLLATDWDRHSTVPLRSFSDSVYRVLDDHRDLMPDDAREPLARLVRNDRLFSYAHIDGIAAAFESISQRIRDRMPRHSVQLEDAIPDLRGCHLDLSADFDAFFPELVAFADGCKREALSLPANPTAVESVVSMS